MKLDPILQKATFIRRYKRFLADIRLADGTVCTIHCPNTGSMRHCMVTQSDCWYSTSDNPKRKYPLTWEIASTPLGHLAGINSHRANNLVKEAIESGTIVELQDYTHIKAEVKYGSENSRIDFLLTDDNKANCYVEVKSVTLEADPNEDAYEKGLGLFPDAVSTRGSKHLRELMAMAQKGHRAVLFFCVQHTGIERVAPADNIDPEYGNTLRQAINAGVEVIAYRANISPSCIQIDTPVPVVV